MSDQEIAHDMNLEESLDKIKMRIWLNEELQIQPHSLRSQLIDSFLNFNSD